MIVSKAQLDLYSVPISRAAYYYGLRDISPLAATMVWVQLSATDLNPLKWGWSLKKNILEPIKTDLAPAPDYILKVIRCSRRS